MPISIAQAILQGANKLRKAGVAEARREAGSLLAFLLDKDRTFMLAHAEDAISAEQEMLFEEFLEARAQGEPAQYITGRQDFYGLEFEVTPDVLIPRPETELLVETALRLVEGKEKISFCDVGTGSGCISVALLKQLPLANGVAVDLSAPALEIAKRNAARHSVTDRIEFVLSDCFQSVPQQTFDLIVSNPPYIRDDALPTLQREVRDFEPRIALTSGADGLEVIRRLLRDSQAYLMSDGHLVFEIGYDQHEAVGGLIDAQVWRVLDIHQDLQGIPRTVALSKK
ncbi:MAG TPA: peptide chain release factor N(5)-glutamine methyltransferase [Pyrinomonadaceae bacterium]